MKIRRFLSVFLLTLLLTGLFCVPQASAVDLPQVNAKAALLMDYESGRMLYGLNERDTEYPASITKVMTALLTLEAVDQGVLTLDQQVAAPSLVNDMDPTGSSADIKEGEVLTVEQLLYCMMLVSANEAACILAETVAGSQDAFVALMNQRAQELGCTGTHFVNPNGLHDPNHYSTAWDIYLFTREAMKIEAFMKICGTASYVVPAQHVRGAGAVHHQFPDLQLADHGLSVRRGRRHQDRLHRGVRLLPGVHRQAQRPPSGGGGAGLQGKRRHRGELLRVRQAV